MPLSQLLLTVDFTFWPLASERYRIFRQLSAQVTGVGLYSAADAGQ
jgi:hypothetical protein